MSLRYLFLQKILLLIIICICTFTVFCSGKINRQDRVLNKIYKDYPELKNDNVPDWDKIRMIRTWIWSLVDVSWPPYMYQERSEWKDADMAMLVDMFESDRGGVWCGGAATTLTKMYRLFGYEAYDMGISMVPPAEEWGSHAMTFVVFEHDGQEIWSLQDAYFNCCVTDSQGNPIDYIEFLKRLKARNHVTVKLSEFEMPFKRLPGVIVPYEKRRGRTNEHVAYNYWPVDLETYTVQELPEGWLKILSPRKASLYEERFYYFKELLATNLEPVNSIYHFLYASHSIQSESDNAKYYLNKINQMLNGIELSKSLPYKPYKRWHTTRAYRPGKWEWHYTDMKGQAVWIELSEPGTHTLNIWMGEDGTRIDQILLTRNPKYTPPQEGFDYSDYAILCIEAENVDKNIHRSGIRWERMNDLKGYTGQGFMQAVSDGELILEADLNAKAPELQYKVNFPVSGRYNIWIRQNCDTKKNDRIYLGVDGVEKATMDFSEVIPSTTP